MESSKMFRAASPNARALHGHYLFQDYFTWEFYTNAIACKAQDARVETTRRTYPEIALALRFDEACHLSHQDVRHRSETERNERSDKHHSGADIPVVGV
jgi:hypothetical protein